ncbi:hypothetical protein KR222_009699, partial [Zaprionus bogoriensis]
SKKSYYFKNDFAYTEDHILVRKLYLFNVTPQMTPDVLEQYFKQFGSVVRLQLFDQPKSAAAKAQRKTGYVLFADARSAAKALQRPVHFMFKSRLGVQPNYSWFQPGAYGVPRNQVLAKSEEPEPQAAILKLNDHCLGHILRLLPLVDRIRFGRTCVRFRSVYEQMSPSLDRSVNFNTFDFMTLWDVRDFFMLSGKNVQRIEGLIPVRHRQRVFEFMGKYALNLEYVSITDSAITASNMHKVFSKLANVKELYLHRCDLRTDALEPLRHLKQLQKLDLSNNMELNLANIKQLPASLEILILSGCTAIQSRDLSEAYKAFPQLKELNLKDIFVNFECLSRASCLETLIVSSSQRQNSDNGFDCIAKIPSLIRLTAYSNMDGRTIHPQLLTDLAKEKATKLQYLEVRGPSCVNNEMLLQISHLAALQTLIISTCEIISSAGFEALCALQNLQELH